MGGLASQQEATQDPFPVSGVGATGETAEVAAEVAEEALGQVGSAQAVAPGGEPEQVGVCACVPRDCFQRPGVGHEYACSLAKL